MGSRLAIRFLVRAFVIMAVGLPVASAAGGSHESQDQLGITGTDLQFLLDHMDEATVVLLDPKLLLNDPEWRKHYTGQVLGFGVRTQPVAIAADDLARIKDLLSDEDSWSPGMKECTIGGDAAVLMRGRTGELIVMLELWCRRAHVSSSSSVFCQEAHGNIDPIARELRALFAKYFPGDTYIRGLLIDEK